MKRSFLLPLLFSCLCLPAQQAAPTIRDYSFKQGEVLDLLLLRQKPQTDSLFKRYIKTAFP
ncbi:MAG: hypothetical protein AAFV07_13215, partial [Bacteroidota bacterium]